MLRSLPAVLPSSPSQTELSSRSVFESHEHSFFDSFASRTCRFEKSANFGELKSGIWNFLEHQFNICEDYVFFLYTIFSYQFYVFDIWVTVMNLCFIIWKSQVLFVMFAEFLQRLDISFAAYSSVLIMKHYYVFLMPKTYSTMLWAKSYSVALQQVCFSLMKEA